MLQIGIALDETVTSGDLEDLMAVFNCSEEVKVSVGGARTQQKGLPLTGMLRATCLHLQMTIAEADPTSLMTGSFVGTQFERKKEFLTHSVFNKWAEPTSTAKGLPHPAPPCPALQVSLRAAVGAVHEDAGETRPLPSPLHDTTGECHPHH